MRPAASLALAATLAITACTTAPPTAATPAIAFTAADGTALGGVTVADGANGLVMTLAATGMPAGTHGLHLHAVGKCEGPRFDSAGPHWNPASKQHGKDNPQGPHAGDLPNISVAADATAKDVLTVTGATMTALQDADGTALVVHAAADDYRTDPSGKSGDRIACAVVAAPK